MIKEAISRIVGGKDLTEPEMITVMAEIMDGEATPSQIASFITALRMKGEKIPEITGAAKVMRERSTKIKVPDKKILDTCGTGGDGRETFNISTIASLVVAGAGITVAKHGNRSVSSRCGSADLLTHLGVNVEMEEELVERCLVEIGFAFFFAPRFHASMRHAAIPRQEIGIRTIFNILGPLTNPAQAQYQLLGVFDEKLTEVMAEVLANLGSKRAFVVWGSDGIDEITLGGKTKISELKDGKVTSYWIEPEDFGLKRAPLAELRGGSPQENGKICLDILKGAKDAKRDVVVLNASFALFATGITNDISEAMKISADSIDSGKAKGKLDALIEISKKNHNLGGSYGNNENIGSHPFRNI